MTRTDKVGSQQWTAVSPFLAKICKCGDIIILLRIYIMCLGTFCVIREPANLVSGMLIYAMSENSVA